MSLFEAQNQVVYQMDPETAQTLRGVKHQIHRISNQYPNRPVRIQTLDGVIYEGRISHIDGGHLFLIIPGPPGGGYGSGQGYGGGYGPGGPGVDAGYGSYGGSYPQNRSLFNPNPYSSYYNNVILPLVLFELLVITLL